MSSNQTALLFLRLDEHLIGGFEMNWAGINWFVMVSFRLTPRPYAIVMPEERRERKPRTDCELSKGAKFRCGAAWTPPGKVCAKSGTAPAPFAGSETRSLGNER